MPRDTPHEWAAWLPDGALIAELQQPERNFEKSFLGVLAARHSVVGGALAWEDIAELLWHVCRTRSWTGLGRAGIPTEHRAFPSAGGLHPVHVVAEMLGSGEAPCMYLPGRHAFAHLPAAINNQMRGGVEAIGGAAQGCTLWLVGDYAKIAAAYENPESLLWRDAGALAAGLCLTAEMMDLTSVPMGVTGSNQLGVLGFPEDRFIGLGAVHIGSRNIP